MKKPRHKKSESFFSSITLPALVCGAGGFFIAASFFTRSYDTAAVKILFFYITFALIFLLWSSAKLTLKQTFNKNNFLLLLPFLAYFLWNITAFIYNPYKGNSLNDFAMTVVMTSMPLMLFSILKKEDFYSINKLLTAACWVTFLYGFLQIIDTRLISGVDIMPWAGFFGKRIFSTTANPNFFAGFVLAMLFVITANFLRTKEKKYLVLGIIGLIDLFFTESKGAWVGMAAGVGIFIFYAFASGILDIKGKRAAAVKIGALCVAAILLGLTVFYSGRRMQSVDFRTVTWRGVADQIQAAPVLGMGAGSFKTVYPAYRRAEIFYIENIHNNETAHAENEFLEVWANTGIIGLAIFLWSVFTLLYTSLRRMKEADGPEKYCLLGFAGAVSVILAHNLFDVSMRFVSTAYFYGLFTGLALVYLKEESPAVLKSEGEDPAWKTIIKMPVFLLVAGFAIAALYLFAEISGTPRILHSAGRLTVFLCSWAAALFTLAGVCYVFYKTLFKTKGLLIILAALLSLGIIHWSFCLFRADYYYGVGGYHMKSRKIDGAAEYYTKAIKLNPFSPSVWRFRGTILGIRGLKAPSNRIKEGDAPGEMLTDFQRGERDLLKSLSLSPNEAFLHQNMGEMYYLQGDDNYRLYYKTENPDERAVYLKNMKEYFAKSKEHLTHFMLLDPALSKTYLILSDIDLKMEGAEPAKKWLDMYIAGPAGVTNPEYLERHKNDPEVKKQMDLVFHFLNI